MKKKVIIVTDGDKMAKLALEEACKNVNARCISMSEGNPTVLSGREILNLIEKTPYDPVALMVDDRGNNKIGFGEKAMLEIINDENIEVMGIIAVASNTEKAKGVKVDCSIDKFGKFISKAVDKYGNKMETKILIGDTVNNLSKLEDMYVVGIGDPGKMCGNDNCEIGSPIMTRAMEKIIEEYNKKLKKFP